MKKFALSLAVLFSVALVSCGGAKDAAEDTIDSTAVDTAVVAEVAVAADSNETVVAVEAAEVAAPAEAAK